ncbi:triosephosphate isomerase [Ordospora colligata]|uniref:Triosephosphate isomerase n=1 Tax=Ordospora colligata OC4 TaxID=1354746 RepID=A0A0B2UID8_9MICR|nr:triosephosphate isomerase [Ordospora colligata OC4]KHN68792.1 triosephosphate isomerase [Ordospora colligata OC4]TBU13826.1 triosephosphate isomerase [Ordospora colligata]TBU14015.1 triosephosphate isomerase [Ordospora colligata]TBU17684.1 triosephosphate isomerase [Ordospora colligata]
MGRRKLLGGNWKMYASLKTFDIIKGFKHNFFLNNDTFIAVPYVYIQTAKQRFPAHIKVGAQDCSMFNDGAYTGEISASMLKEMGVEYVIIGHSERRRFFGDDSQVIASKIRNACKEGLSVVLCVGECLDDRESGQYLDVIKHQLHCLERVIRGCTNIDIAYEPVWAIGTNRIPTNSQIKEVICKIKAWGSEAGFEGRVVYGGSVSMLNCQTILEVEDVDGFLVGGASQNMDFCMISSELSSAQ